MQAEFAASYIRQAKDRMESLQSDHVKERLEARDHAIHQDESFNRNERRYIDSMIKKVERQGKIFQASMSPNSRFKNHALQEQERKAYFERL